MSSIVEKIRLKLLFTVLRILLRISNSRSSTRRLTLNGDQLWWTRECSHPNPLPGLNFFKLIQSYVDHVHESDQVLEMGAGSGVFSFLCLQKGASVTATDLPEVDLSGLVESAQHLERGSLSVQTGDLFEAVHSHKFSKIFFNPPFHLHPPRSTWERAYFGGGDSPGEHVVIRFLETCPLYLKPHGNIGLILSARERNAYQPSLHPFDVSETKSIWLPLIGRVSLLILQLKDDFYSKRDSLSDLSQVEDV